MSKIFLSYAREDIAIAKRIYNDLKRYGLDVWFDQVSLLAGQNWEIEIENAIENCDYFLALLSNNSLTKKGYVQKESRKALDVLDLYPESEVFIIPVKLEECNVLNRKLLQRQWIDLFPESEYENGIRKILQVVRPGASRLRSQAKPLSSSDVIHMIKRHGFFDVDKNESGSGFANEYDVELIESDKVVNDRASGLMWQQSGSSKFMGFKAAKKWIRELNQKGFAGYQNWRLPTLDEALTLMEREKKDNDLHIDPVFDHRQGWIWTSDLLTDSSRAWIVFFDNGNCGLNSPYGYGSYVRAVRSIQPSGDIK